MSSSVPHMTSLSQRLLYRFRMDQQHQAPAPPALSESAQGRRSGDGAETSRGNGPGTPERETPRLSLARGASAFSSELVQVAAVAVAGTGVM
jgi:hypothetical protein